MKIQSNTNSKMVAIHPKKSLGQNFLINTGILDKIVSAAELSKNDTVLEIGPGTGNLTRKLTAQVQNVVAVEKDRRLIEQLRTEFPTLELIEGDILKFSPKAYRLEPSAYKIIGNIPYYLTSHLLRTVFEDWPIPKLVVLTIQKEVAQRIVARPPQMSLLALTVQYFSDAEIISYISRGSFRPMPKVDSAILRLRPRIITNPEDRVGLFNLMRAGFSGKRKQLAGNLSHLDIKKDKALLALTVVGLRTDIRAESLSLKDWQKLYKTLLK